MSNEHTEPETEIEPSDESASTAASLTESPSESTTAPQTSQVSGDHTMGMVCHLMSFLGFIGIPLGNIIGPLIIWLTKKDQDSFVDATGKAVLNFQISVSIYAIACGFLILFAIGLFLLPVVLILSIVYTIIGAVKANDGEVYQYPFTIQFIK